MATTTFECRVPGVSVLGNVKTEQEAAILSPEALTFVATLHRSFNATRKQLLAKRSERQSALDRGEWMPDFLPETESIRNDASWQGAPLAPGLEDRRVEITGPVDRKMIINALNSGASTYMADFEDSNSPTWENCLNGQVNLYDAIRETISLTQAGKNYSLRKDGKLATLLVRPRGWHMVEKHLLIDGEPASASIVDFGLYFFHNAAELVRRGKGPYFYLPKMESHLEARLWNDIFNKAQDLVGLPRGTIRATVLIETILAAFEMDEILYELRQHAAGLNCGRWDYIFSFIKCFRENPQFVLPDRSQVTMTVPFMDAYVRLLIKTCHKRGVHAMGGMAAQIPIKDDPVANEAAMAKVRADKLREVTAGHGTWVAHPHLIPIALEEFNRHMPQANQIHVKRDDVQITQKDLLAVPTGTITEHGIRDNIQVGLQYMEAWLRGVGCVPIHHLMEDAATAEISRSQLWQWARHKAKTHDTGITITGDYLLKILDEETDKIKASLGAARYDESKYELAKKAFATNITGERYDAFLTTLLYDEIVEPRAKDRS